MSPDDLRDGVMWNEEKRAVRKHLRRLPENLQYVLRRLCLEDATPTDVSVELGTTESKVREVEAKALREVREKYMVYCEVCRKTFLDGPEKCPKCKNRLRHLRYGEDPPRDPVVGPPPAVLDEEASPAEPEVDPTEPEETSDDLDENEDPPNTDESAARGDGPKTSQAKYRITLGDRSMSPIEWAAELGLDVKTVYARMAKGLPPEEILAPVHPGRSSDEERTTIEHYGKKLSVVEWSKTTGIAPTTILWRLRAGWSPEEVLSTEPATKTPPTPQVAGVELAPPRKRRRGHQPTPIEHTGKTQTIAERYKEPSANRPEEPRPGPKTVKISLASLTPENISVLVTVATCSPGSVLDESGILEKAGEIVKKIQKIEADIALLETHKIEETEALRRLLGS